VHVLDLIIGALALIGLLVVVSLLWDGVKALRDRGGGGIDLDELLGGDDSAPGDAIELAQACAEALEEEQEWFAMTPEALELDPRFVTAVAALSDDDTEVDAVVDLSRHPDGWSASMALAALERRDDVPPDWADAAIRGLPRPSNCEDAFQLRAIARHAPAPSIGRILARVEGIRPVFVVDFVRRRIEAGEMVGVETFRGHVTVGQIEELATYLDRFGPDMGDEVRAAFDEWRALELLGGVGRVWKRPFDTPPVHLVGRRSEIVDRVLEALTETPRRSVLLVGEHGSGKTAVIRGALDQLDGAVVFEATASQVLAGTVYIGELDGRVRDLTRAMSGRNMIWVLPELQEALFAGQHHRSPHGLLDALLPTVESGTTTIVAEVTPTALEVLRSSRPRVTSAFDVIHLRTLDQDESIEVARHALEHDGLEVTTDEDTLVRTYDLAQQFLPGASPPGNLLRLVHAATLEAVDAGRARFDTSDVLQALTSASGLPLTLLDARVALRLEDVRAFFEKRILQQPDAVSSVVERVAMIKAGLTDPTRPLGVFLFLGPTGTGKTEIAKAFAEFLFGSPDRLVRLDMSEFQTPESLERLLSDTSLEGRGAELISAVRRDPFSVVLLDEFEKAAEPVWDVFLQVFDDGRLTDSHGRLVDFRRCVIVLTSNVGSAIAAGPGVGFEPREGGFSETAAERALRTTFRPELLNRIDRVVLFRPFERSAMRSLLDKELSQALARRGLRERPWAVEVDESASAFLIDKGFSPELGARPLRRAIEQHVLVPVATAIVEQTVPEGDQFLFVSAPGGTAIEVTFVDPDAGHADDVVEPTATEVDLRTLARAGRGDGRSVEFLLSETRRIVGEVAALEPVKAGALAALGEPTFWETPGRFAVLAKAEYVDRLEAATRTAARLAARLERGTASDGRASADIVRLLAARLHVLGAALDGISASDPFELFLEIGRAATGEAGSSFASELVEMYLAWGRQRGMDVERLSPAVGSQVLAVSGLGCWRLLEPEAGLHVLEEVDAGGDGSRVVEREVARVRIAPRQAAPRLDGVALAELARQAIGDTSISNVVVRRYRKGSSPLVRDSVRGYRTGSIDRILAGGFDLG
jgi:ATP-dependent Clp protease ATP-binding subunit ClpC